MRETHRRLPLFPIVSIKRHQKRWRPAVALGVMLAVTIIGAAAIVSQPAASAVSQIDAAEALAMERVWGVRLLNVALTGHDGLIDVRYQVVDPDKALGLHDADSTPALIDEATGVILDRPGLHSDHKVRSLRPGGTYYLLYQNNGGLLKPGSRITLKIGEVLLRHITIQ